jgi:hypothetical protein
LQTKMENSVSTSTIDVGTIFPQEIPEMLRVTFRILYPNGLFCDNTPENYKILNDLKDAMAIIIGVISYLPKNMRNEPFVPCINFFSENYQQYDDFPVTTLYDFYNSYVSYLYALEHNTVLVKNTIQ